METPQVKCPKCGSSQLSANKKGFSGKKAVVGGVLTGGVGLLAGTLGSNKIIITCLNCGNQFKPGSQNTSLLKSNDKNIPIKVYSKSTWKVARFFSIIGFAVSLIMACFAVSEKSWVFLFFCILLCFVFYAGVKNASSKILS